MKSVLATTIGWWILLSFISDFAAAVEPREIHIHELGTIVTYARFGADKPDPVKVPQVAADRIIAMANKIKPHSRPVPARPFQPAPIGSFTIGKKTWLHLHEGGRLEDPSYQGIQTAELKGLAKLIEADGATDATFLRWAREFESKTETEPQHK